jgi:hypothetical protein
VVPGGVGTVYAGGPNRDSGIPESLSIR